MKKLLIAFLFLFPFSAVFSQSGPLDRYVQEALQSNLALQQKEISYEKSLAALREAKAMYLPQISLQARYSMARGGRAFEFPIGDLVNPVYENLNLLNTVNSQTPDYPSIPAYPKVENQQINFLRETEQETTIRATLPIFNAAIRQNQLIKQELTEVQKISVEVYKTELTKEVKTAYFNYLKAQESRQLFTNTLALVQENLRTTKSLYRNHQLTIDQVYAAEVEVKSVEQQLAFAQQNQQSAKAFFNFLLNRDYDQEIEIAPLATTSSSALSLDAARNHAQQNRAELQQIKHYLSLSGHQIQLNKSNYLPQVNLIADYGIQGTNYNLDSDSDFAMGSVVLSWNLFDRPTKAKIQQSQLAQREIQQQLQETRQQIGLQVVNAFYELETARKSIELAQSELSSAQKAYKLVAKKYSLGQDNLVSLTNARTQLTNAEQKLNIARYDYQIKVVALERVVQ